MATVVPLTHERRLPSSRADLMITESTDPLGLVTLRVRGALTSATIADVRAHLGRHSGPGASLLLDLTGVREIDPVAVGALMAVAANIRSTGGRVAVLAADPILRSLAGSPLDPSFAVSITLH